jgi:hypothetical protein
MTLMRRVQLWLLGIAALAVTPLWPLSTAARTHVVAECGATASVGSADPASLYDPSCSDQGGTAVIGGAPDAGTIIACHDVPGCLSYEVNNPGGVSVPHRSTGIQQSQ